MTIWKWSDCESGLNNTHTHTHAEKSNLCQPKRKVNNVESEPQGGYCRVNCGHGQRCLSLLQREPSYHPNVQSVSEHSWFWSHRNIQAFLRIPSLYIVRNVFNSPKTSGNNCLLFVYASDLSFLSFVSEDVCIGYSVIALGENSLWALEWTMVPVESN